MGMVEQRPSRALFVLYLLMALASFAAVIYIGTSPTGFAVLGP
jgi:hypothetical protein